MRHIVAPERNSQSHICMALSKGNRSFRRYAAEASVADNREMQDRRCGGDAGETNVCHRSICSPIDRRSRGHDSHADDSEFVMQVGHDSQSIAKLDFRFGQPTQNQGESFRSERRSVANSILQSTVNIS